MYKNHVLFILILAFCFASAVGVYAAQCEYVKSDKVKVDDNGYIMSWLFLDPYIDNAVDSAVACNKDYFADKGGEAKIKPKENEKVKIAETKSEHVWTRVNFLDLKELGQIPAAVGGNEMDIACWGARDSINNKQEYLVTYLKWKSDASVIFTVGVDDAAEVYFNGELIVSDPSASQDWGAGNAGIGNVKAKSDEWNILVVGCYESSGEWGLTVQVNPVPDEVDNSGPKSLFAVKSTGKLAITWGSIKE